MATRYWELWRAARAVVLARHISDPKERSKALRRTIADLERLVKSKGLLD
jgi:hypothetical protein